MEVKELVQRFEIVNVNCDICGKSCKSQCSYEYVNISHVWGYGSDKDGVALNCDICENCWDKVEGFIVNELKGNVRKDQL